MRIKGVTYDTGFVNVGTTTKEVFNPKTIEREMQIIKNDLHCNAVRIYLSLQERSEQHR